MFGGVRLASSSYRSFSEVLPTSVSSASAPCVQRVQELVASWAGRWCRTTLAAANALSCSRAAPAGTSGSCLLPPVRGNDDLISKEGCWCVCCAGGAAWRALWVGDRSHVGVETRIFCGEEVEVQRATGSLAQSLWTEAAGERGLGGDMHWGIDHARWVVAWA